MNKPIAIFFALIALAVSGTVNAMPPHTYSGGYPPYLCADGSLATVIGDAQGPVYLCVDQDGTQHKTPVLQH